MVRLSMRTRLTAVALALVAVLAFDAKADERTPAPKGAKVFFTDLKDGQTIPARSKIRFGISGMILAPAGTDKPNAGHHHLLIDTELPPLDVPIPSDFNNLHFGKGQAEAEVSLTPGPHTLQLLLGDHNHVPHDPPVMSEVIRVNVDPGTVQKMRTPAPKGAKVFFIDVKDGQTVPAESTIKFGLSGMDLAPAGTEKANTGHHHLLIDAPLPAPDEPIPSDPNNLHFGKGQTEAKLSLTPGEHRLRLLLGDHNHIPHDPPVVSGVIHVKVEAAAAESARTPAPSGAKVFFTELKDGQTIPAQSTVKFGISGMELAPAGTEKANTGHHHLLIDTDLPPLDEPIPADANSVHFGKGQTEAPLSLPPGKHTLRLLLGDHNHIPHDPPVMSSVVQVNVAAATAESTRTPAPSGAKVFFTELKDGQTIPGKTTVKFGISGMELAPAGTEKANTGHHHLLIDTELPPLDEPIPADANSVHFGKGQTEAELSLPPGKHKLRLLLGDHNHIPHDPPVMSDVVQVTVAAATAENARTPAPNGAKVFFTELKDGQTISPQSTIKFGISGMELAPAGTEKANAGHHHLLIDTELPPLDAPIPSDPNNLHFGKGQTEAQLSLTPGPHTLRLLLGDHNHIPHDPPVMSEVIRVNVGAATAQGTRTSAPKDAKVFFTELKDGQTIAAQSIIKFGLSGMELTTAGTKKANSGHHHLLIDTELPPLDKPIPNDPNNVHFGKGQSEVELSLTPGPHTLRLLLGDHDHIPHDPPVMSEVIRVNVDPATAEKTRTPAPADAKVSFVGLSDGARLAVKSTIQFGLSGMEIAPAGTQKANAGHHHLLIDTPLPPFDREIPSDLNHLHFGRGQTSAELTLTPGEHTLQLLLGDHQHVPHDPPVFSNVVRVTVTDTTAGAVQTVTASGRQPSPPDAVVYFVYPRDGDLIYPRSTIRFGLRNMGVAPAGVGKPNTGHHHLIVDADPPAANVPIPNDPNHLHFGNGQTEVKLELKQGEHTLQLVLADEHHVPHDPPVMSPQIKVTVGYPKTSRSRPSVRVSRPGRGQRTAGANAPSQARGN